MIRVIRGRTNGVSPHEKEGRREEKEREKKRAGKRTEKPADRIRRVWSRRFALYKTYISQRVLHDERRQVLIEEKKEGKSELPLVSGSRQTRSWPLVCLVISWMAKLFLFFADIGIHRIG